MIGPVYGYTFYEVKKWEFFLVSEEELRELGGFPEADDSVFVKMFLRFLRVPDIYSKTPPTEFLIFLEEKDKGYYGTKYSPIKGLYVVAFRDLPDVITLRDPWRNRYDYYIGKLEIHREVYLRQRRL